MGAGCSGSAPVVPEGDQQPLPKRERRSRLRPSTDWTLSTGHEDLIDQIEAASKKSKSKEHEQDAASAQTRPHARVVLLGAGSVGKSTLVRLLNQDRPGYYGERSTVVSAALLPIYMHTDPPPLSLYNARVFSLCGRMRDPFATRPILSPALLRPVPANI